jgi:hypothetical protein
VKYCECTIRGQRVKAPMKTSWTDENPGRRFFSCRNYSLSEVSKKILLNDLKKIKIIEKNVEQKNIEKKIDEDSKKILRKNK